jgi:hypothetical protein
VLNWLSGVSPTEGPDEVIRNILAENEANQALEDAYYLTVVVEQDIEVPDSDLIER